jgi:hypothetical protein
MLRSASDATMLSSQIPLEELLDDLEALQLAGREEEGGLEEDVDEEMEDA